MVLYSADLSKFATAVKSVDETHKIEKPKRKRPTKKSAEQVEEPVSAVAETSLKKRRVNNIKVEQSPVVESIAEPKKKRVRKPAVKSNVNVSEPLAEPVAEPVAEPAAEPAVKRVRVYKKCTLVKEACEAINSIDDNVTPPIKRVKRVKEVAEDMKKDEAPGWFLKYVEGVKKEEAVYRTDKVSSKEVKQEANDVAQKSWGNGLTRDRVTHEVDNHMNRMYGMIFSRR